MNTPSFALRASDAFGLLGLVPDDHPLVNGRMAWLKEEGLAESVPAGRPTEGGGVLISATRLRFELYHAFEQGKESLGPRELPPTEAEWQAEFADWEGDSFAGADRRPIIVENWHDPNETPTQAIQRLNSEVVELAEKVALLRRGGSA